MNYRILFKKPLPAQFDPGYPPPPRRVVRARTLGSVVRRGASNIARVGALAWLAVHFSLTALYLMPINPLKWNTKGLADMTIGAFYPQNWSLFAPNPASSDTSLLVLPLSTAEMSLIPQFGLPADGWYDVCDPFWRHFQQKRFSAYDRLVRPATNALRAYMGSSLDPWVAACKQKDAESCRYVEKSLAQSRKDMKPVLSQIASGFCKDIRRPGQEISYVALRFRDRKAVPWSHRYDGTPKQQDYDLFIVPFDPSAPAPGVLSPERKVL